MKNSLRLPVGKTKKILGFTLLLSITLFLTVFLKLFDQNENSFQLTSYENKFKLNFNLQKKDEPKFSQILEKLSLPQSTKEGIEFELDATSQAKLSYFTPIAAKLAIKPKEVSFKGSMARAPFSNQGETSPFISGNFAGEKFIIPTSTNLVIFGPDFRNFLKVRFTFPKELATWIDDNLISEHGQYLIIFGQNADLAIILRSEKKIDSDSLRNMSTPKDQQPVYKEELQENVTFHLLNLPQDEGDQRRTFTFFQIGQWSFFVSSNDAARILAAAQKSPNKLIDFPEFPQDKTITAAALFASTDQNPPTQDFYNLLFGQIQENTKILEKIAKFEFILKGKDFSGIIEIK